MRRVHSLVFELCFGFLLLCSSSITAQQLQLMLAGTTDSPVGIHVHMQALDTAQSIVLLSDSEGKIDNGNHPNTRWAIRISHIGYKSIKDTIPGTGVFYYELLAETSLMDELTLTGQYKPTRADQAIANIKVIDKKTIADKGATDLEDLLRTELNIDLQQDNILGAGMTMQGLGGDKIKILIDGVPVIGRLDGNIDLSQILLTDIERVELVQGPLGVEYGTSALAGTINLITKKKQQHTIEGNYVLSYESVGQSIADFSFAYKKSNHRLSLSGRRLYFDGYDPIDSLRAQQWKPKEQDALRLKYQYSKDKLQFRWQLDYFNEEIDNKGDAFILTDSIVTTPVTIDGQIAFQQNEYRSWYAYDELYQTLRFNNALYATFELDSTQQFRGQLAYNFYERKKNSYRRNLVNASSFLLPGTSSQDTSKFDLWNARFDWTYTPKHSNWTGQLGTDISIESAYGARLENQDQEIGDYAIFLSTEYVANDKLKIRPGLRYAKNTDYKAPLVPSINMRYALTSVLTSRFSWGKGFRAPSLKELYLNFVDINHNVQGNSDLKAEYSDSYQLSFDLKPVAKSWRIETGFFYNNLQEAIRLASVDGGNEFRYVNVAESITYGGNLQWHWQKNNFSLLLNRADTWISVEEQKAPEDYIHSTELGAQIAYTWKSNRFSLSYKYTGERKDFQLDENNELFQSRRDSWHMADFFWRRKFALRWVVNLGVRNIFDVKNISSNNSSNGAHSVSSGTVPVAWGRSFQLRIDFKWPP